MIKYAENWWYRKGQYYSPNTDFYPKMVVIDAFMAGFDAGRVIGKNESQDNKPTEADK